MSINWNNVTNFSASEFPEDPDLYADPQVIYALDQEREWLGKRVWPSPAEGGLARFGEDDRGGQHFAAPEEGIYSKAVDRFPEGHIKQAWLLSISSGLWGAVGIYTDTNGPDGSRWPMLHSDLRAPGVGHSQDHMLLWHKDRHGYHYIQYDLEALDRLITLLEKLD